MKYFRTPRVFKWIFPRRTWGFSVSDKKVYLTFDDGPCPEVTQWVLDYLNKEKIPACFFCVGENVEKYPDVYQRILDEGHRIGNHTYQHEKGTKTKWKQYLESINKTDQLVNSPLFRPPYGRIKSWQSFRLAKRFQIVMWTWLSYDFDRRISLDEILNQADRIKSGDILLLHDNPKVFDRVQVLLPQIVSKVREKGLEFSVIPD